MLDSDNNKGIFYLPLFINYCEPVSFEAGDIESVLSFLFGASSDL